MSEEWITTKEAARRLDVSVRRVVDRIHKRKLWARRDGKIWLVHSSLSPPSEDANGVRTASERTLEETVRILTQQIEQKDKQIERQQIIIMQLSRDIESQQKLLEYHRSPWWRRWFRKAATRPPDEEGSD